VASEELKALQRNALIQQARTLSSSSALALPSQPVPNGQLQTEGAAIAAMPVLAGEHYLVFSLVEREFAIKAQYVQSVERLADVTPVPNVVSWVSGVINLRGSIASVVDLRAFLALEKRPYDPLTRLLSVQYNEMVICLVVDGVSEMLPIPETFITNTSSRQATIPAWAMPYVSGSALLGKRVIVLLDAARLLFADKMQRYTTEL
jgi:purine-binding chemotaxis protein CheW